MHVIAGLEVRELSALRGLLIDTKWTFPFASPATMPAGFNGTRGGACTAACSRAHAAGVVGEVCQTVKTSASPLIWSKT